MSIASDLSLRDYEQEPGRFELDNPSFVEGDDDRRTSDEVPQQRYTASSLNRTTPHNHGNGNSSSSTSSSDEEEDEEDGDSGSEYLSVGDYREFGGTREESSGRSIPHAERVKQWDVFESQPTTSSSERVEKFFTVSTHLLKIGTYLFLLVGVVILNMLSKGSLLMAASNLRAPHGTEFKDNSGPYLACQNYSRTIDNNGTLSYEAFGLCVMVRREDLKLLRDSVTTLSPELSMTTKSAEYHTIETIYDAEFMLAFTDDFTTDDIVTSSTIRQTTTTASFNRSFPCIDLAPSDSVHVGGRYYAKQCDSYRGLWAWSLFIIVTSPYAFVFLRCAWRMAFKETSKPSWKALVATAIVETIHSVGVSVFAFIVLPSADNVILGLLLMLSASCVPSLMLLLSRNRRSRHDMNKYFRFGFKIFDILAFAGQVSTFVLWPILVIAELEKYDSNLIWAIPLSLICLSVRWWENFLEKPRRVAQSDGNDGRGIRAGLSRFMRLAHNTVWDMACEIYESRIVIDLILSLWKILLTFGLMIGMVGLELDDWNAVFSLDSSKCAAINGEVTSHQVWQMELDWLWVWLTSVCSSLVCYFLVRSAAKMRMQRIGYALPLALTTPTMFIALSVTCSIWNDDECSYTSGDKAGYLFFRCYVEDDYWIEFAEQWWWVAIFWWLSQIWVTVHVWFSMAGRLDSTDKLFMLPLYDGVVLEQSLLLNRTRDEKRKKKYHSYGPFEQQINPNPTSRQSNISMASTGSQARENEVPLIYICATMWHESRGEMITMLTSIFKLDKDQAARRNAQKHFEMEDPDFYEFEGHIFFDNAMESHEPNEHDYRSNSYVRLLVSVVEEAARACHGDRVEIDPPMKISTPYGGRLVWKMPGGNEIIVHLKDSAKIRHKKRWSQVMYMYYFLGYKLWAEQRSLNKRAKQRRAENTFLMALDGDVDFEPEALAILVDLLKRNKNVGAACGRIHPTGSGPVVWYQKFEYAVGHWMQKATEHVIGCVLCSPGCFSLFRGSALMDDNVMHKYTTKPTKPIHYIQYDQGEDRWLCTLLLQQGYRVEYAAASDSYTCAPEDLDTLLNQRRRWMPSTMANIWDLLISCFQTTAANENISVLYVVYQMGLFFASIVGPGTILMMVIGAVSLALKIEFYISAIINFIPVIAFIFMCYWAPEKVQLGAASILSLVYCVVQIIVLIGLIVQMASNELLYCDPNAMFFLLVSGTFVLCGILHPREILSLVCGIVYYLSIPTMYMILMIYAMCNLHVVSWGTREVKKSPAELQREQLAAELKKAEEASKSKSGGKTGKLQSYFYGKHVAGAGDDGWKMQCGSCCKMICCMPETSSTQREVEYKLIVEKMNSVERTVNELGQRLYDRLDDLDDFSDDYSDDYSDDEDDSVGTDSAEEVEQVEKGDERPVGTGVEGVGRQSDGLDEQESDPSGQESVPQRTPRKSSRVSFRFNRKSGVIVESLTVQEYPDDYDDYWDEDEEAESAQEPWIEDYELGNGPIKELPDNETYFFQDLITEYLEPLVEDTEQKKQLSASLLTLRNKVSGGFFFVNGLFVVTLFSVQLWTEEIGIPWFCDGVKLDALGLTFMIIFGVIIVIQVIGMLIHRTGTFLHIMSKTELSMPGCCRSGDDGDSGKPNDTEGMISLARELCRLDITEESPPERRITAPPPPPAAAVTAPQPTPTPTPATQPQKPQNRRRKRRRREKRVVKIEKRSRAVSRVAPTCDEAFSYRLERLRNMTDADVDRFIQTRASSSKKQSISRSMSIAIKDVHRRITHTGIVPNGHVANGNVVQHVNPVFTPSQFNNVDETRCLVVAEPDRYTVGSVAAHSWSNNDNERRATTNGQGQDKIQGQTEASPTDVRPTSAAQVEKYRSQRITVAVGPFDRRPIEDERPRRRTVHFQDGGGRTSTTRPDPERQSQSSSRAFLEQPTTIQGSRDGMRRRTDAVRFDMPANSSGTSRRRSMPTMREYSYYGRRTSTNRPDYAVYDRQRSAYDGLDHVEEVGMRPQPPPRPRTRPRPQPPPRPRTRPRPHPPPPPRTRHRTNQPYSMPQSSVPAPASSRPSAVGSTRQSRAIYLESEINDASTRRQRYYGGEDDGGRQQARPDHSEEQSDYATAAPDDFRLRSVSEVTAPAKKTVAITSSDTDTPRLPRATEAEQIELELRGAKMSVNSSTSFYV